MVNRTRRCMINEKGLLCIKSSECEVKPRFQHKLLLEDTLVHISDFCIKIRPEEEGMRILLHSTAPQILPAYMVSPAPITCLVLWLEFYQLPSPSQLMGWREGVVYGGEGKPEAEF
jgi:hypothetical protein